MREFFHGWRRKAGCVSLVMACGLMVGWGRSIVIEDRVTVRPAKETLIDIYSEKHSLTFVSNRFPDYLGMPLFYWSTSVVSRQPLLNDDDIKWHFRFCGWGRGTHAMLVTDTHGIQRKDFSGTGVMRGPEYLVIPYWTFTVPLTILSAYLLLRNPQRRG